MGSGNEERSDVGTVEGERTDCRRTSVLRIGG